LSLRRPVLAAALAVVLVATASHARAAGSSARGNEPDRAVVQRAPGRGDAPFAVLLADDLEAPIGRTQRPAPALTIEQGARLGRARALRVAGQLGPARDSLARILATVPHHPDVLTELALVHSARRDWRSIEQLARAERMAMRDSLVLVTEFVESLERSNRPRDAAQAVIEAWIVAPDVGAWAAGTMRRLAAEEHSVSALLRAAAAARPGRPDLVRSAARLEWDHGDPRAALALLAGAERPDGTPLRWTVAEEMLGARGAPDSLAAVEVLLDLAADTRRNEAHRLAAAHRVVAVARRSGGERSSAPRVARALGDLPPERWGGPLVIAVARGLRAGGLRDEARRLLASAGASGQADPQLALERALEELRAGADERVLADFAAHATASPEAGFRYAEALFFAGRPDSALAWYGRVSRDAGAEHTGAALERMYLIEDADPRSALPAFGRLAWQEWREEPKAALDEAVKRGNEILRKFEAANMS